MVLRTLIDDYLGCRANKRRSPDSVHFELHWERDLARLLGDFNDRTLVSFLYAFVNPNPRDREVIRISTDIMTRQEIEDRRNVLHSLVRDREAKLKETDYVAAKIAEGAATKEEYAAVLSRRRTWRGEINDAEAGVAALDAEVPEDEDAVSAEATEGRP